MGSDRVCRAPMQLWISFVGIAAVIGLVLMPASAAELVRSRQDTLGAVTAGTAVATQRPALPADAGAIPVLTCVYQTGGSETATHYWLGAPPPWHRAIPAAHPLNQMVLGTAKECPAALSAPAPARAAAPVRPSAPAPAPAAQPAREAVPLPSFELTGKDFKATGLEFERAFVALYTGDFDRVPYSRESTELLTMMDAYIDVFGRGCAKYLPANKVEVTEQVCAAEMVTRNGYGVEISRYCSDWRTRGTGVFADPDVYAAYRGLEQVQRGNALGLAMSMIADGGAGVMGMAQTALAMKSDTTALVKANGCDSRALHRFQDNMRLYAVGNRAIVISDAGSAPVAASRAAAAAKEQNYTKLIDDLVAANSSSWMMNQYIRGSASRASVVSTDGNGRPRRVRASYTFEGFSGRTSGSVTVEFTQGRPQCMYFWDRPADCRAPDRGIVSRYENGAYATAN